MGTVSVVAAQLAALLFVLALVDACISDLRAFEIPDRDSFIIIAAFLALAPSLGLAGAGWHLLAGVVVFVGGAVLFALNVWGGGDVKLCAAVALMTGFGGLPRFLVVMTLAGGVVALGALVVWRLRPGRENAGHVPYGLAIAAGGFDWLRLSLANLAG